MQRRVMLASLVCLALAGAAWLLVGSTAPAQTEEAKQTSRLRTALEQTLTLDFTDLSLDEVGDRLHAQTKVSVVIDSALAPLLSARAKALGFPADALNTFVGIGGGPPTAMVEHGTTVETERFTAIPPGFSCRLHHVKLAAALDIFLSHYGLGYALLGDTLVIATADRALQLQRRQPVSLTVENMPLTKVLEILSQTTSVDLVLDPRGAKEARTAITLKLRDVALERGVELVAELADLKAVALGNLFLVTTPLRAEALRAAQAKTVPVKTVRIPAQVPAQPLGLQQQLVLEPRGVVDLLDVDVPAALLQKAGPAPRGVEAERKAAKVAPAAKKPPTAADKIRYKLREAMPEVDFDNSTLGAVLNELEKKVGFPKIIVNHNAFKEETPDLASINETPVKLTNVQGIPKSNVLRLLLDQIPTNNAVFLVRPDFIEITTNERSLPEMQFIEGSFQDVPLEEALAELSDRSGLSILVDARAAEKARTPVSARFQNETNLATAVRLLADMADLKLVIVDRMLYVTLRSNTATFPPGRLPAGKQRSVEAA